MGWGAWMATSHSLERQAQIEIHRREVRVMPEDQLRALADHLVCCSHNQAVILRNAMRRIAELEMQSALFDSTAAARSLKARQRQLSPVGRLITWCRGLMGLRPQDHPKLLERPVRQSSDQFR